jgi:hypothetical protein
VTAQTRAAGPTSSSIDRLLAVATALVAFAVYQNTLLPDLGTGDTAKFQYLGRVLGTAHHPGYPLYIVLSHAFSYVPVGSLAFRMNLFSALLAAAAVGVAYLVARAVGCRRPAAAGAALALGWGRVFWSQAIRAEVYALGALLLAGALLGLVRWGRERRPRQLIGAAVCVALALGNHLTILMVLPGVVFYVLLTDRGVLTRPRTLAIVGTILLAGLAQYGFIVLRTWQRAPFVESRASSVAELVDVLRGAQFSYLLFVFDAEQLVRERIPRVATFVRQELGAVGLVLLAIGLVRLPRREALLLIVGSLGVVVFALNYDVGDLAVFLIPVFVLSVPAVGVGVETLCSRVERLPIPRGPVSALLAASLPLLLLVRNHDANDQRGRTLELTYFNAVFAALPSRAAIVYEDYKTNQMVLYKLAGERAAGPRDIRPVSRDPARIDRLAGEGRAIYAFNKGRDDLAAHGFHFARVPLRDRGRPVGLGALRLFRLQGAVGCAALGTGEWQDAGSLAELGNGRLVVRAAAARSSESEIIGYALTASRPRPRAVRLSDATPWIETRVFALDGDDGRRAAKDRLRADGAPIEPGESGFVTRMHVRSGSVVERAAASLVLDLGAQPSRVIVKARTIGSQPLQATVCPDPLSGADLFDDVVTRNSIPIGPEGRSYFVSGWHEPEPPRGYYRWTSAREARLVVPLAEPDDIRFTIGAEPRRSPGGPDDSEVALVVNGHAFESHRMQRGAHDYEWTVPAWAWLTGLNEVVIVGPAVRTRAKAGSGDTRAVGMAVHQLGLTVTPRETG